MPPTPTALDDTTVSMVPLHDARCCFAPPSFVDRLPAGLACATTFAGLIGLACLIACVPLTSFWALGAVTVGLFGLAMIPSKNCGATTIAPGEISDKQLSTTYRALCDAHAELANVLVATKASPSSAVLLDRSRDTVVLCGRVARTTNAIHQHLDCCDVDTLVADESRLRDEATRTTDPDAAATFTSAADGRARHLATVRELGAMRDRVRARLELATVSLQTVTAGIVRLQAVDDEAFVLAASSVSDHAASLTDELDALATTHTLCAS
jgi:hypothetical protein